MVKWNNEIPIQILTKDVAIKSANNDVICKETKRIYCLLDVDSCITTRTQKSMLLIPASSIMFK